VILPGEPGFDSLQAQEIFHHFAASRQALRPGQLGAEIKLQEREADNSSPSNAEDKNGGATDLLSHAFSWCCD
jgi:hypothetical protein